MNEHRAPSNGNPSPGLGLFDWLDVIELAYDSRETKRRRQGVRVCAEWRWLAFAEVRPACASGANGTDPSTNNITNEVKTMSDVSKGSSSEGQPKPDPGTGGRPNVRIAAKDLRERGAIYGSQRLEFWREIGPGKRFKYGVEMQWWPGDKILEVCLFDDLISDPSNLPDFWVWWNNERRRFMIEQTGRRQSEALATGSACDKGYIPAHVESLWYLTKMGALALDVTQSDLEEFEHALSAVLRHWDPEYEQRWGGEELMEMDDED